MHSIESIHSTVFSLGWGLLWWVLPRMGQRQFCDKSRKVINLLTQRWGHNTMEIRPVDCKSPLNLAIERLLKLTQKRLSVRFVAKNDVILFSIRFSSFFPIRNLSNFDHWIFTFFIVQIVALLKGPFTQTDQLITIELLFVLKITHVVGM